MIFDREKVLKTMIESGYYEKKEFIIQEALNQCVNDKTIKHIEVEGVDLEYIIEKDKSSFFSAITTMNFFLKKPELAKKFKEKSRFHRGKRK